MSKEQDKIPDPNFEDDYEYEPIDPNRKLDQIISKLSTIDKGLNELRIDQGTLAVGQQRLEKRMNVFESGGTSTPMRPGGGARPKTFVSIPALNRQSSSSSGPKKTTNGIKTDDSSHINAAKESLFFPDEGLGDAYCEANARYLNIRDSVSSILLPNKFSLGEGGFPCDVHAKKTVTAVRKVGSIIQTSLKVLKTIEANQEISDPAFELLYSCLFAAHMQVRQEQKFAIVEGSDLPPKGVKYWKFFKTNNGLFDDDDKKAFSDASQFCRTADEASSTKPAGGSGGGNRGRSSYRGKGKGQKGRGYNKHTTDSDVFEKAVDSASNNK